MSREFDETAEFVQVACIWEATARKVGNVHRGADFPGTELTHFLISAAAIGSSMGATAHGSVGRAVLDAAEMTRHYVGQNTNLGILLLLAPLCIVWWEDPLDESLPSILDNLTVEDARLAYRAIRLASPGGLGTAPDQDVTSEPHVNLLEAMRLAAGRDMVARQYANGFRDVFGLGVPAFQRGFAAHGCVEAAIVECQFAWLAAHPDSLIARKNGPSVAEDVRRRAAVVAALGLGNPAGRAAGRDLDRFLRSDGNRLNPGTTADLVTACLFVALRENMVAPSAPFRWQVEDWL